MKKFSFLILVLILAAASANGQNNRQQGSGVISGIVYERSTHTPLEAAAITLYKQSDSSLVTGTQTDVSGKFTLNNVPFGRYKLEANLVGYSIAVIKSITVNGQNPDINLDTIKLKEGTTTTEEIEVTAERGPLTIEPDKKVFNVSQDLINQSGSATDLLRNVPSVTVDVDGNVSLRGSGDVKILIDGKPSGLDGQNRAQILEQIPASSIESIELITNPSAKFEAEGNTGIINILTKRNVLLGYNGSVTLGTGTKDKYNGGISFSLKNNKINLSANYNYRLFNMGMTGDNFRSSIFNDATSYMNQLSDASMRMNGQSGKISLEYFLTPKQSFTLSSNIRYRDRKRGETTTNNVLDELQNLSSFSITKNTGDSKGTDMEFALNYNGMFGPKQTLTGEISYSHDNDDDNLNVNQQNFLANGNPDSNPFLQNTYNKGIDEDFNAQLDYVHPFGKDSRLEAGIRGIYRSSNDDFNSEHYDYNTNTWIADNNLDNHFVYKEQIYSAYASYTGKLKDFGYQLGLRTEQTFSKGNLITTGETFDKQYLSFFPSINLSQQLSKSDEMQISYSRRINRPRLRFLNPYTDYSDPYNLRRGNPDLKPEYIDSYELSYVKYLGKSTITPSIFVRNTHDAITRTYSLIDSNTSLVTFDNVATELAYGTELIVVSQITPWLNVNGNISYFRNELKDNSNNTNTSNYTWQGRIMSTARLPLGFSLQLAYNYTGEDVSTQGTTKPMQSLDAAIRKDFLNDKASLNFRISDIFNTQKFETVLSGTNFTQTYNRQRDSRTAFLTFTYKFGTPEKQQRNKRQNNEDENNGEEDLGY
jgi:outer membrane receptor protein involved in Fe transport